MNEAGEVQQLASAGDRRHPRSPLLSRAQAGKLLSLLDE
jgi:hypothetical protein